MADVHVAEDGTVTIDGKVITPQQEVAVASKGVAAWREVANKQNWSVKNLEKLAVYVAALVSTTNVMGQVPVPNEVKGWVLAASGFVLAAIHISTPKAP